MGCGFFKELRNHRNPMIPEMRDASKIEIFDSVINNGSSYASNVMKIDIVNPIPARNPIPKTWFHFKPNGNVQTPIETARKLNKKTPKGFPIINPAKIPKLPGSAKPVSQPVPKTMAVFAKAKSGRIIKATGLCSQFSIL